MALKVAEWGFYGGNLELVRQAPVTDVLDILDYKSFQNDYEYTEWEMNNPSK